ncbi:TetR/AcrR family transcriptional regulator [Phytohabitans sp. ZYX-F-186]|uniref:TetR/AcrR family transcriptional regulator n=1 Tax=Phytohabitans maris TaxID=3071409 RepID=A0ABU0ZM56_9ACTN|nr:TetR/AcrR family transcriptional regulator [Phytohabitans sp. ZYX-F-186]MDQ7907479.1 TetR/AcrR family transcriptional regulator [Phytohabitans sp. ZYX-F-186]
MGGAGPAIPKGRDVTPRRDAQIAQVAGQLFQKRGYANVAVRDVAAAVGVTAPAVYRHFPGKQALLLAAIESGLALVDESLQEARAGSAVGALSLMTPLSRVAVERRDLWLLVRRESRHLPDGDARRVRGVFSALVARMRALIAAQRADLSRDDGALLSHAALATLEAPSQYPQRQARAALARALAEAGARVAAFSFGALPALPPPASQEGIARVASDGARAKAIFAAAAKLFAERGYPEVSLDDIGAAVGISGPSIYHHFSSKSQILARLTQRAFEAIELNRTHALRRHGEPRRILRQFVVDQVALALTHNALYRVFTDESIHLDSGPRQRFLTAQRSLFDHWVSILVRARPDLTPAGAYVQVSSGLCVVNDMARSRRLKAQDRIHPRVAALVCHHLGVDGDG